MKSIKPIVIGLLLFTAASFLNVPTVSADQPNMPAAIEKIEEAKAALERAEADKGGYRVMAITHVNQAIAEARKGIGAAKKSITPFPGDSNEVGRPGMLRAGTLASALARRAECDVLRRACPMIFPRPPATPSRTRIIAC